MIFLEYDQQNKLFISMGQDSCIQIQKQCSLQVEEDVETLDLMKKVDHKFHSNTFLLRQMKNNFYGK